MQLIDDVMACIHLNYYNHQCNIKQAVSTQNMKYTGKGNKLGNFIYISCKNIVKQAVTTEYWQLLGLKNNNSNKTIQREKKNPLCSSKTVLRKKCVKERLSHYI